MSGSIFIWANPVAASICSWMVNGGPTDGSCSMIRARAQAGRYRSVPVGLPDRRVLEPGQGGDGVPADELDDRPLLVVPRGALLEDVVVQGDHDLGELRVAGRGPEHVPGATSLLLFIQTLIGNGLGPSTTGFISDWLRPSLRADSLRYALVIIGVVNIWAAFHYAWAARTLRDDLRATEALAAR